MHTNLEKILQNHSTTVWRGSDSSNTQHNSIPSGFADLDAVLPGQGWPTNALLEVVTKQWGIGELQLLLPAMINISHQGRRLILISPPYIPYAPALVNSGIDLDQVMLFRTPSANAKDILWSMEKVLRATACGMALAWPEKLTHREVRRLQLAAEAGKSLGVLFRSVDRDDLPTALRIHIYPVDKGLTVQILKARGGHQHQSIHIKLSFFENLI